MDKGARLARFASMRYKLTDERSAAGGIMITVFVRHTVPDVEAWQKAVDDFAPTFKAYDVVRTTYYRSVDNPNDITALHEFETIEAARAFEASDELRQARPKAGVVGQPMVWFTTQF